MAWLSNFWRRLTGWIANLRRRFFGWITAPRAMALLLGVLGVVVGYGGYLYRYCACEGWPNLLVGWEQLFLDFYANVAASLVTITIAVLTIDWLNERRAEKQLKAQLIREMGSRDHGFGLRAVQELRAHGWLGDGSLRRSYLLGSNLQSAPLFYANLPEVVLIGARLQRANLHGANLEGADLRSTNLQGADLEEAHLHWTKLQGANLQEAHLLWADLHGADLTEADLTDAFLVKTDLTGACLLGADLTGAELAGAYLAGSTLLGVKTLADQQLVTVYDLRGATMFDGSHYDGRFILSGDIKWATEDKINPEDPKAMANFYEVPLEDYLAGQEWAREHLPRLRREAELEQEEVAETGEAPQPEPPIVATPSSSTPTSPVVPAKGLLSFTLRRLIGLFWRFLL